MNLDFYLQALADIAKLPGDVPREIRKLMQAAHDIKRFFLLLDNEGDDFDEAYSIEIVGSFRKQAEAIREGRPLSQRQIN